ncbi:MAG: hypothetical protein QM621_06050 [Aeromicrobium sp.]|uniref:hypothetical protein n=1 Tax=Aeromicrobium sp. TaxID=1871063 RepID=UPI0039E406E1
MSQPRAARRIETGRWRDLRLLGGVALVIGAMVVGGRLIAALDDAERYWAVSSSVRAGDPVDRDDLVAVEARLASQVDGVYARVDEELPAELDDLRWTENLTEGAMVGRDAWSAGGDSSGHLPVSVPTGSLPADIAAGDLVDVWVGPGPGEDSAVAARRVVEGARVVDAGEVDALAATVSRTIVLDLGAAELLGEQVAALAAEHVTVVRVP